MRSVLPSASGTTTRSPERTLHSPWHDFGPVLVAAGIPVATVAASLGHPSPSVTTRLYLHPHDPAAQAAVEVAAAAFVRV